MLPEYFALIGVGITFIGGMSYLIDTIKGKVKPNRVSWIMWGLAPLIAFFAQLSQGVGITSAMTFIVGFVPLLVFIASFFNKKSEWKITRFDLICGGLSILGLTLWLFTRVGNVAIFFSIMADLLAGVPTLVKAYKEPQTESAFAFFLNAIGAGITLLAIHIWDFANAGFTVYIFLMCVALTFLIKSKIGVKSKIS